MQKGFNGRVLLWVVRVVVPRRPDGAMNCYPAFGLGP